jgi:hypothetical protein
VRTTIVLPAALDQNLVIFCAREEKTKSEVVVEVLKELLTKKGLQPLTFPTAVKIDVTYD